MSDNSLIELAPASMLRRLGAIIYDTLVLIGLEMVLFGILGAIAVATLGNGEATEQARFSEWVTLPLALLVPTAFYCWFWIKGGRTLGMQAWRIQVRQLDGRYITLKQGLIRCATGLFGLALVTGLFSAQKRTLNDLLSHTQVVHDPHQTLNG